GGAGGGAGRVQGKRYQPHRHREAAEQEGKLGVLLFHRRPGPPGRAQHAEGDRRGAAALPSAHGAGQLPAGGGSALVARAGEPVSNGLTISDRASILARLDHERRHLARDGETIEMLPSVTRLGAADGSCHSVAWSLLSPE